MADDRESRRKQARERFRAEVQESLARAEASFRGQYAPEIEGLLGLSETAIREITPDPTAVETYDKLIGVVKAASRQNIAQAE